MCISIRNVLFYKWVLTLLFVIICNICFILFNNKCSSWRSNDPKTDIFFFDRVTYVYAKLFWSMVDSLRDLPYRSYCLPWTFVAILCVAFVFFRLDYRLRDSSFVHIQCKEHNHIIVKRRIKWWLWWGDWVQSLSLTRRSVSAGFRLWKKTSRKL